MSPNASLTRSVNPSSCRRSSRTISKATMPLAVTSSISPLVVVSPFSARGYNLHDGFDMYAWVQNQFADVTDPTEFIATKLPAVSNGPGQTQPSETGFYPHAGLLTTFHYTYYYKNTATNRNRARARMVFRHFLGVDVMALAPAVNDAAAITAQFDNPTMESGDCTPCHTELDPVAGIFQQYDLSGALKIPNEPWYDDMVPPGFSGEVMPTSETWRSVQWLGERIAADPRFAVAMAEHAYYVLTQEKVATAPIDITDPLYASRLHAYNQQRALIQSAADAMVDDGFNFKAAIGHLVLSKSYRAVAFAGDVDDPQRMAQIELLGVETLLTPEQLDRKMDLLFGFDIHGERRRGYGSDLLYGGLDFRTVVERISVPNAVMGAKVRKWASSAACYRVPEELKLTAVQAIPMFPYVTAVTDDEAAIRQNLAYLHWSLLGRSDAADSAAVDHSWELWDGLRADGAARIAAGDESDQVSYSCRPSEGDRDDAGYIVRAWQGLVTYLVRRPEFLGQ